MRNIRAGYIVILKEDNLPQNQWKMAKVIVTVKDRDGLVRRVKIPVGQGYQEGIMNA